ncbi:hypothetical protein N8376_06125 [Flavobacteriaceae bacterium]|nr:hypothetical protein [Flavobacteriaceae bacterium]
MKKDQVKLFVILSNYNSPKTKPIRDLFNIKQLKLIDKQVFMRRDSYSTNNIVVKYN